MSHLEFYGEHGISPVRQDVSDLERHFQRRESLYRQLGILPQSITGRSVLEVGPGSGYNSVYTASLNPKRYVLVEGNPTGISQMEKLFDFHRVGITRIDRARLEDWRQDGLYDFVFCEGILSGVSNPEEILRRLSDATAEGGVLTIATVDHLSHFPETLRRAFALLATKPEDTLETKVSKVLPMFEPHLRTLSGMSRRDDDWVIDNLLHPSAVQPLINFAEAIDILSPTCDFYASSPHIVTDWRWYKDITGDREYNQRAISQYWENAHNMLDYRDEFVPRSAYLNSRLYGFCTEARGHLARFEQLRYRSDMAQFREILGLIIDDVVTFSHDTAESLMEAAELLEHDEPNVDAVAGAQKFGELFGRGQQYLSFTRRAA